MLKSTIDNFSTLICPCYKIQSRNLQIINKTKYYRQFFFRFLQTVDKSYFKLNIVTLI